MNFSYLKSISPVDLVLFVLFALYVIFPMDIPSMVASSINSALGMIVLFCMAVYFFMYRNPLLGVVFIFVAYELIRRSTAITGRSAIIEYTPSQNKKDAEMVAMNPPKEKTLEEDMVELRAPIGKSAVSEYIDSSYKPIVDKVNGASLV
jgi:hypothetical protein